MKTLFFLMFVSFNVNANANFQENLLDELDPRSPDIEERLQEMDEAYEKMTGEMPFLKSDKSLSDSCYRNTCAVWSRTKLKEQIMYIYIDGVVKYAWPTSTGRRFHKTPHFDQHPNGRIYDSYSSNEFPGGDYNGLGNMPYAVFISGGYAIHGTIQSNWHKLGKRASKGCLRLHPENGFIFNRLVRTVGISSTWITVEK